MLDRAKLKNDLKANKAYQGVKKPNGPRWGFLNTKDILDGAHRLRFCWPHTKCFPAQYLVNSTYRLEVNPDDEGEVILSSASCDVSLDRTMEPCYLVDRLLYQIIKRKLMSEFSPNMQEAINKLIPWKRFLFPVAIMSTAIVTGSRPGKGKNAEKSYDDYQYSPTEKPGKVDSTGKVVTLEGPHPRIWEISADAEVMCTSLFKCLEDYEEEHGVEICDPQRGALVTMQRSNNVFTFVAHSPSAVDPVLVQAHSSMMDSMKKLRGAYKDPDAIQNMVQRAWFFAKLRDRFNLDVRTDDQLIGAGERHLLIPDFSSITPLEDEEGESAEDGGQHGYNTERSAVDKNSADMANGGIDFSGLFDDLPS